jgi:hypothetical protein
MRLLVVAVIIVIQASLLICERDTCWNEAVALPPDHPVHKILSQILRKAPLPLAQIQTIAQTLIVVEAVIILNLFFKFLCSCLLWIVQLVLVGAATHLCYLLTQQDTHTSFLKFRLLLE